MNAAVLKPGRESFAACCGPTRLEYKLVHTRNLVFEHIVIVY